MKTKNDYSFKLPKNLIAENAANPPESAKLMIISQKTGKIVDETRFSSLPESLSDGVLFFNDSRVIRSRIPLTNAVCEKKTGEKITFSDAEIFFLEKKNENTFEALVRPGKKMRIGNKIFLGKYILKILENTDSGRMISITGGSIEDFLERYGKLPLPPYIEYKSEKEHNYQSIFAKKNGSVAAPTASLHFSENLMQKIHHEREFVTLHIGLGTFRGIDTENIFDYKIHWEKAEIDTEIFARIANIKKQGKMVIAVGTTACRTLESLPSVWKNASPVFWEKFSKEAQDFWEKTSRDASKSWTKNIQKFEKNITFETQAYITPGYKFCVIDELITNFHLPESSLLVLVSALIGHENIMKIYAEAIMKHYRFFSFWDGMYLKKC